MAAKTTQRRIEILSKSKSVPEGFIEDKIMKWTLFEIRDFRYPGNWKEQAMTQQSLYSDCRIAKDWKNPQPTQPNLSSRLVQLVEPRGLSKDYVGDRPSPIWQVSSGAMNASPSARLETLSRSKSFHSDYKAPKSVYSRVSDKAKSANASARVEYLAKPKNSEALPTNQTLWEWSEWNYSVSTAAKSAATSDRTVTLSAPKRSHGNYRECREVQWKIADSTLKALPSLRVQQLARPKSRSQYIDHHNENAYKVSSAARHAQATPRVEELCTPLPRKVRQKKMNASKT